MTIFYEIINEKSKQFFMTIFHKPIKKVDLKKWKVTRQRTFFKKKKTLFAS